MRETNFILHFQKRITSKTVLRLPPTARAVNAPYETLPHWYLYSNVAVLMPHVKTDWRRLLEGFAAMNQGFNGMRCVAIGKKDVSRRQYYSPHILPHILKRKVWIPPFCLIQNSRWLHDSLHVKRKCFEIYSVNSLSATKQSQHNFGHFDSGAFQAPHIQMNVGLCNCQHARHAPPQNVSQRHRGVVEPLSEKSLKNIKWKKVAVLQSAQLFCMRRNHSSHLSPTTMNTTLLRPDSLSWNSIYVGRNFNHNEKPNRAHISGGCKTPTRHKASFSLCGTLEAF